ncbi:MAG TPA: hypothetical protein PKD52_04045 [Clostridiales bacterium]|nr:hypothetical protein [Clostridiales bacterium]
MTSCDWAIFVNIIAIMIAQNKTTDEMLFLAALYSQLGDTLAVLATQPPDGY